MIKSYENSILIMNDNFNQPLKKDDIPINTTHITFGCDFNQPLNNLANIIELKLINPNELFINNLPNLYYKLILINLEHNVINLPININEIITNEKSLKYIKNIPYGCTVNLIN